MTPPYLSIIQWFNCVSRFSSCKHIVKVFFLKIRKAVKKDIYYIRNISLGTRRQQRC